MCQTLVPDLAAKGCAWALGHFSACLLLDHVMPGVAARCFSRPGKGCVMIAGSGPEFASWGFCHELLQVSHA